MRIHSLLCLVAMLAGLSSIHGEEAPPLVLTKRISLPQITGGFNHHSADGKLHRLFLCSSTNKTVDIIDLDTGRIVKSLPGEKPSATCFVSDLNVLCVSRGKAIELYDAKSLALLTTLPLPCSADELHYDAHTKQLLAGSRNPSLIARRPG